MQPCSLKYQLWNWSYRRFHLFWCYIRSPYLRLWYHMTFNSLVVTCTFFPSTNVPFCNPFKHQLAGVSKVYFVSTMIRWDSQIATIFLGDGLKHVKTTNVAINQAYNVLDIHKRSNPGRASWCLMVQLRVVFTHDAAWPLDAAAVPRTAGVGRRSERSAGIDWNSWQMTSKNMSLLIRIFCDLSHHYEY